MGKEKKSHLTLYIVVALVLAVASALLAPKPSMHLHVGGEIFLRLLKMLVVPLVMASVMTGILGMGDIRKLGKPGGTAVLYYLTTTVLAVIVGLVVVNLIQPGAGVDTGGQGLEHSAPAVVRQHLAEATDLSETQIAEVFDELPPPSEEADVGTILNNLVLMLVTDNLIMSAAEGNLLPLIIFSIIFAGMLTTMGDRVSALTKMIGQVNDALMSFIMLLMKVAPLGIFCLVAARFGKAEADGKFFEELQKVSKYMAAVLTGLSVHALITLPLIYWIFAKKNPYRFMVRMSQAIITAFSTASSSATLPVTMECASEKAGVSKQSTEFVLPLGATINMDGTALYEAVAAIFIAQALGMELTMMDQAIIAITATLAAIGAAGIPEAGLVTMIIVLNAVGLPLEGIGLILAVDWLLDRFRTAVNVLGDSIGAAVVEKSFPASPASVAPARGAEGV